MNKKICLTALALGFLLSACSISFPSDSGPDFPETTPQSTSNTSEETTEGTTDTSTSESDIVTETSESAVETTEETTAETTVEFKPGEAFEMSSRSDTLTTRYPGRDGQSVTVVFQNEDSIIASFNTKAEDGWHENSYLMKIDDSSARYVYTDRELGEVISIQPSSGGLDVQASEEFEINNNFLISGGYPWPEMWSAPVKMDVLPSAEYHGETGTFTITRDKDLKDNKINGYIAEGKEFLWGSMDYNDLSGKVTDGESEKYLSMRVYWTKDCYKIYCQDGRFFGYLNLCNDNRIVEMNFDYDGIIFNWHPFFIKEYRKIKYEDFKITEEKGEVHNTGDSIKLSGFTGNDKQNTTKYMSLYVDKDTVLGKSAVTYKYKKGMSAQDWFLKVMEKNPKFLETIYTLEVTGDHVDKIIAVYDTTEEGQ